MTAAWREEGDGSWTRVDGVRVVLRSQLRGEWPDDVAWVVVDPHGRLPPGRQPGYLRRFLARSAADQALPVRA